VVIDKRHAGATPKGPIRPVPRSPGNVPPSLPGYRRFCATGRARIGWPGQRASRLPPFANGCVARRNRAASTSSRWGRLPASTSAGSSAARGRNHGSGRPLVRPAPSTPLKAGSAALGSTCWRSPASA